MADNIQAVVGGTKLPLWAKLTASAMGILFAGIGMSQFLSGGSMRNVVVPLFVGSVMIYVSGYERSMYIGEDGVARETSFWGQRKRQTIEWSEIADARVIMNKGGKAYVLMHSMRPVWPMEFKMEQADDVIAVLNRHLEKDDIKIER